MTRGFTQTTKTIAQSNYRATCRTEPRWSLATLATQQRKKWNHLRRAGRKRWLRKH
jgi:hypothetical protein